MTGKERTGQDRTQTRNETKNILKEKNSKGIVEQRQDKTWEAELDSGRGRTGIEITMVMRSLLD